MARVTKEKLFKSCFYSTPRRILWMFARSCASYYSCPLVSEFAYSCMETLGAKVKEEKRENKNLSRLFKKRRRIPLPGWVVNKLIYLFVAVQRGVCLDSLSIWVRVWGARENKSIKKKSPSLSLLLPPTTPQTHLSFLLMEALAMMKKNNESTRSQALRWTPYSRTKTIKQTKKRKQGWQSRQVNLQMYGDGWPSLSLSLSFCLARLSPPFF